jgi:hypothetical protein
VHPIPAALLATALVAATSSAPPPVQEPVQEQAQEQHPPAPGLPERVAWETDLPQALAHARELDRPLLIVFR